MKKILVTQKELLFLGVDLYTLLEMKNRKCDTCSYQDEITCDKFDIGYSIDYKFGCIDWEQIKKKEEKDGRNK